MPLHQDRAISAHKNERKGRKQRKAEVREMLRARDADALLSWARAERNPGGKLIAMLFDPDALVQWRAIEALMLLARESADRDLEKVRGWIRRLFWQMNDESGGLVWRAPEAIAAILLGQPTLIDEFGRMLASFLREEPFERGAHWAVAQLVRIRPACFSDALQSFNASLSDPDPGIRAHALATLAALDRRIALEAARHCLSDTARFPAYCFETGNLRETTVAETAASIQSTR